jgi:hypothetical protein
LGAGSSTITVEFDDSPVPVPVIVNNLIVPDGTFIPSFGLPILTEFRCYSSDDAIGFNRLDTSLAMDPGWAAGGVNGLVLGTSRPYMRIFSSGGVDTNTVSVYRDPDLESTPRGGYNYEPFLAPVGVATAAADNVFYLGQLDFVIRVSRATTVWRFADVPTPVYAEPVLEPRNDLQPNGTSVILHFRGATGLGAGTGATADANVFNMYGNIPSSGDPLIFEDPIGDNGPVEGISGAWTSNINDIDGFSFFQVRITFINNAPAGTSPELAGMGFAYERQ